MLHILRPVKAPGFAYAWLEIVSHRVFMGRILATNSQPNGNQKGNILNRVCKFAVCFANLIYLSDDKHLILCYRLASLCAIISRFVQISIIIPP